MAINQEIVSYIKAQLSLGVSQSNIIESLKKVGWQDDIISEAYNVVVPNNTPPIPRPNIVIPIQPTASEVTKEVNTSSPSINSPYSNLLAILLFVSLFILTNGIFSDIEKATQNTNSMLLFEGLFVIPFLLIAVVVHNYLKTDNNRFRVLSLPYFIMSGWVLLQLLWKVAQNIYQANSGLAVYVVLIMIVVVLTGIIIFIQRFFKK